MPEGTAKIFVFSDESGSWHDPEDVYVRAWVAVSEASRANLVDAIDFARSDIGCSEIKWRTLAGNSRHFDLMDKFEFRVFLTVSSPGDIRWERKYRLTRNFATQIESVEFGELDDGLVTALKKKMFDDIKNVLFLHFYERTHIANAKSGIERVIRAPAHRLIYRVDPPQMSKEGWKSILEEISPGIHVEFPRSEKDEGIQFAGIVAGCVRSFLVRDHHYSDETTQFVRKIRPKLIARDKANPNPNLIFFGEISDSLKRRAGEIWTA